MTVIISFWWDNRPAFDLTVVLEDAKPLKETVSRLALLIDEPYEDLMDNIEKGGKIRLL